MAKCCLHTAELTVRPRPRVPSCGFSVLVLGSREMSIKTDLTGCELRLVKTNKRAAEIMAPGLVNISRSSINMVLRIVDDGVNDLGRVCAHVEYLDLQRGKIWKGGDGGYSGDHDLRLQLVQQHLRWVSFGETHLLLPEEWT